MFLQDENDVYILTKVSDILHSVFSSYKEKVLPWFEQLLQLIVQLIVSTVFLHQSHYIHFLCIFTTEFRFFFHLTFKETLDGV